MTTSKTIQPTTAMIAYNIKRFLRPGKVIKLTVEIDWEKKTWNSKSEFKYADERLNHV